MHEPSGPEPLSVLALFRDAAGNVPAYARFLREQGVDPGAVGDPSWIPLMTKINYHQRYGLSERCRGGRLVPVAAS